MALAFELTFAGYPFVSDTAKVIRQPPPEVPYGQVDEQQPVRKQQPEVNLIDELNRLIPFHNLNDFRLPPAYAGRNLGAIAIEQTIGPNPYGVRIGEWYYPVGATRWSVFRGLATSSQVKLMLAATYQPDNPAPAQWPQGTNPPGRIAAGSTPALFSMTAQPLGPASAAGYTVTTPMYMLPPRPLAENLNNEGLFLVTLVDERYWFQYVPTSAFMTIFPDLRTWEGYANNLQASLGVTINFSSPIPDAYTNPEPDSQLWINMENCAVLLDTVAYNLGCRVVRNLDATYTLQRPEDSVAVIETNLEILNPTRLAGGNLYDPTLTLATGSRAASVNRVVPNSVNVSFPLYCPKNKPVPHFLNPRTLTPQRPSAWYETSYGDVWIQNVPLGDVAEDLNIEGIIGTVAPTGAVGADNKIEMAPYVHAIHTTAKAMVPEDGSLELMNETGIQNLATQIASDYYGWQAGISLDIVFPGTAAWIPEGGHDVVWTYSERMRLASCRVTRTHYNHIVREMQHTTPVPDTQAFEIFTNNPPGVGGLSVAQSWRDCYSGTPTLSLAFPLPVSGTYAVFDNVDYLPTQNRWKAQIDDEKIEFEGTSGGILFGADADGNAAFGDAVVDTIGYAVDIVPNNANAQGLTLYARGIDSTLQDGHIIDSPVVPLIPNTTYGANVITVEKGQFAHFSDWGEGIQGVNLIPQTQTVFVYDGWGRPTSSGYYYSGAVIIADDNQTGRQALETIWIRERNDAPLRSGYYYNGQLFGYTENILSGTKKNALVGGGVAPLYLVDFINDQTWSDSFSGVISTTLTTAFNSGGKTLSLDDISYLPTQNRWKALVGTEVMLLNGTSGGKTVDVVVQGIDGTKPDSHAAGTVVSQVTPDTTFSVEKITFEKGQFVYPQEISVSGREGLTGLHVVPQTQTVKVLDEEGTFDVSFGDGPYYSGVVVIASDDQTEYRELEFVWIVERDGCSVSSGQYYDGQLFAYSPSPDTKSSVEVVAPIYLVNKHVIGSYFSVSGPPLIPNLTNIAFHSGDFFLTAHPKAGTNEVKNTVLEVRTKGLTTLLSGAVLTSGYCSGGTFTLYTASLILNYVDGLLTSGTFA